MEGTGKFAGKIGANYLLAYNTLHVLFSLRLKFKHLLNIFVKISNELVKVAGNPTWIYFVQSVCGMGLPVWYTSHITPSSQK